MTREALGQSDVVADGLAHRRIERAILAVEHHTDEQLAARLDISEKKSRFIVWTAPGSPNQAIRISNAEPAS
ncbi:hypothetical protein [Paraburkholderia sp. UYCP14C]|uniref:hypothetical protein n=1 Tax=Paraburkholderia sp. UYCP14C TaxID=2511130 RepID=UPI001459FD18|nr:hypothetical protein [Paraburkholderia sp. UYCP14C]